MNKDVSSAKSFTLHFKSAVRSLIYTRKSSGPSIEPWGCQNISPIGALSIQDSSLFSILKEALEDREKLS